MTRSEYLANQQLSAHVRTPESWTKPAPRRHVKQPVSLINRLIGLFTS